MCSIHISSVHCFCFLHYYEDYVNMSGMWALTYSSLVTTFWTTYVTVVCTLSSMVTATILKITTPTSTHYDPISQAFTIVTVIRQVIWKAPRRRKPHPVPYSMTALMLSTSCCRTSRRLCHMDHSHETVSILTADFPVSRSSLTSPFKVSYLSMQQWMLNSCKHLKNVIALYTGKTS